MSAIQQLITEHMDIWTAADTVKRSGRGRASGNAGSVYGVKKLRELILELAVRGKLVPQDAKDEPASELLKRIKAEKAKLITEGKLKKETPLAPIAEDEKLFKLPNGWLFVRLREIATHLGDGLHGTPIYTTNGKYYFVNGNNLKDGKIVIKHETKTVDVSEYLKYKKPLNNSSVLVSINGTLGTVGFYEGEPIILGKSACYINLVPEKVSKHFVKQLIDAPSFMEYALKNAAGTTIKNLGLKAINDMPIAIPPLTEQHRIVAKVDELMALCDQLEAQHSNAAEAHEKLVSHLLGTLTQSKSADDFSVNWQRIAAHFDTLFTTEASIDALKQTLLQLSMMGKLVPQDSNDEPAIELLKRIQAEKAKLVTEGKFRKDKPRAPITEDEKLFELPKGWEWVRLVDIIRISSGDGLIAANMLSEGGIPVFGGNGINGYHNQANIDKQTLVIGRVGYYCGSIHITPVKAWVTDNAFITQFSESNIALEFLCWLLKITNLKENDNATAQPVISGAKVYPIVVALPPLAEQYCIVAKVDELMMLCDQLKTRIQQGNQQQQTIANVLVAQVLN